MKEEKRRYQSHRCSNIRNSDKVFFFLSLRSLGSRGLYSPEDVDWPIADAQALFKFPANSRLFLQLFFFSFPLFPLSLCPFSFMSDQAWIFDSEVGKSRGGRTSNIGGKGKFLCFQKISFHR